MARRSFDVVDVTELMIHWHAGRSQSELAVSLGLDRKTVKKYLAPAFAAGITPGDAPRSGEAWAVLVRAWWPGLVDTRLRQTTWPQIKVHHEFIKSLLGVVTVATIWQRLRDEHGLDVSVASLRRYVRANLPEDVLRSKVTVLRDDPPAGQEAQIDYGYLGSWVDPVGGRPRRVWANADGARVFAAHVRPSGAEHGPGRVDPSPCGGVRVLSWCPGKASARQFADRGGTARFV
jgi:hypothetical protein